MVTARYLEDYAVGQIFGSGRLRVEAQRIKSFAAEFDPQPFHLDETLAGDSIFRGLAASGWHTAAMTMRLLVDGDLKPAGGIIGTGFDEFGWPHPVRPGDELHIESEVLDVRPSRSRPDQGLIRCGRRPSTSTRRSFKSRSVTFSCRANPASNSLRPRWFNRPGCSSQRCEF